jgi:hypothetical protein
LRMWSLRSTARELFVALCWHVWTGFGMGVRGNLLSALLLLDYMTSLRDCVGCDRGVGEPCVVLSFTSRVVLMSRKFPRMTRMKFQGADGVPRLHDSTITTTSDYHLQSSTCYIPTSIILSRLPNLDPSWRCSLTTCSFPIPRWALDPVCAFTSSLLVFAACVTPSSELPEQLTDTTDDVFFYVRNQVKHTMQAGVRNAVWLNTV